jgi:hypothetical protein
MTARSMIHYRFGLWCALLCLVNSAGSTGHRRQVSFRFNVVSLSNFDQISARVIAQNVPAREDRALARRDTHFLRRRETP